MATSASEGRGDVTGMLSPGLAGTAACFGRISPLRPAAVVERTFLFADLVGFTAVAEARGDMEAARLADRFAWLTREALDGAAQLVKTLGDGVMVVAEDPAEAIRTALALLRLAVAEPAFPGVAAGLHRGTAVALGFDYIGTAVNVAARVVEQAGPGQILCTSAVACDLDLMTGIDVEPVEGAIHFKNIAEPALLFQLSERPVIAVTAHRLRSDDPHRRVARNHRTRLFSAMGKGT